MSALQISTNRSTRRPARFATSLLVILVMLLRSGGHQASAFTWFTFDGAIVVWSGGTDTRWLSDLTFAPGSAADTAILYAAGAWNTTGGSSWVYTAGGAVINPPDQLDGVSYTEAVPSSYFDNAGTIAVTFLGNDGATWIDMDTLFNAEAPNNWQWTLEVDPPPDVLIDPANHGFVFSQVAMHEFGHAFGLGHEDTIVCSMNSFYPNGGTFGQANIIEPMGDDRAGQRHLYHGGIFTDLGNSNFYRTGSGSSAPVFFEPTEVDPGDQISLRVQIENLGTTTVNDVRQGFYLSTDEVIDADDTLLGTVTWSVIGAGLGGQFDFLVDLPPVLASGDYYLGSILDDLDEVTEAFEDNNAAVFGEPLTIRLLTPVVEEIAAQSVGCRSRFTGPTAVLSEPLNMRPVTWALEQGPSGMTINAGTGVVTWPLPLAGGSPHLVTLRATNATGDDERSFQLFVDPDPPTLASLSDATAGCGAAFVGQVPVVTNAACAGAPLAWNLEDGPVGMSVDFDTGVINWPAPFAMGSPHLVTVEVFNAAGKDGVSFTVRVFAADANGDAAVDAGDVRAILSCHTGPGGVVGGGCACSDQDGDGDVDLIDFGRFQVEFAPTLP